MRAECGTDVSVRGCAADAGVVADSAMIVPLVSAKARIPPPPTMPQSHAPASLFALSGR
ncbi:hypothetical protein GCM10010345_75260 [Streptomyces canarius]|uniref:Uncharacterized protein n=1 Tax=Streptomyces canarius TaxID=285453 RepID=A0ABQ3D5M9_9ACTN|nr:hypothetical protein GCM10010345_75260 [Streptomyces canarius]